MVVENNSDHSACGVPADDWRLLLQVIRSLMNCEETMRLYPRGHQRGREAVKAALSKIQEYHATTRRVFTFVPELALDLNALENQRGVKDVITLANRCREHLIRRLAIHPEVDCESLEALVRHLESSTDRTDEENSPADPPEWAHVEIEYFHAGEESEGYRFSADGDQLVAASGDGGVSLPDDMPPSLRRNLAWVFSEPEIRDVVGRLRSRMGLGPKAGAPPSESVQVTDLMRDIVESLYAVDAGRFIDAPHDVLTGKIRDFLKFLDGIASGLQTSGAAPRTMSRAEIRDLVACAVGMQYPDQAGVAEIFEQSSRLKALLAGTDSFRMQGAEPEDSGVAADGGAAPRGNRLRLTKRTAGDERESDGGRPSPSRVAERSASASSELPQAVSEPSLPSDASWHEKIDFDAVDYELEALRIRTELMAAERSLEGYQKKRVKFLERFGSRRWPDAATFLDELDGTVQVLADRESDRGVQLTGAALNSQGSQEFIDRFFQRRVEGGASIPSLRPVIQCLAAQDVSRPVHSLSLLWWTAKKQRKNEYVDELFSLTVDPEQLAKLGTKHSQVFCSRRSLSHLKKLPCRLLENILRRIIAPEGDPRPGPASSAATVLHAALDQPGWESVAVLALRRGPPQVKKEALGLLDDCSSGDMLFQLTRIIKNENASDHPDLDQVHLALRAMVTSNLPQARAQLKRFKSERHFLRHVYQRDIRELLDLMSKVSGVTL